MVSLLAATAFFVGIHLLSGSRLRDHAVARLGEGPYRGLFSLASAGGLAWIILAYRGASQGGSLLWLTGHAGHAIAMVLLFIGIVLAVAGMTAPNPTSVGQEGVLDDKPEPTGMQTITRHPFLWGTFLWAVAHLIVNGDSASVVLFGGFAVLAVVGTFSIDRKRERALGEAYVSYSSKTSNVPFVAIATGRARLRLPDILDWRVGLGIAVYLGLIAVHPVVIGVSALM